MRGVAVSFAMIGLAFGAYAAEPVVVAQRASPERAAALSAPEWVGRLEKAMAADDTVEAVIEYRPAASAALGPQRERTQSAAEVRTAVSGGRDAILAFLRSENVQILQAFDYQPLIRVRISIAQAQRLAERPDVVNVHLEEMFERKEMSALEQQKAEKHALEADIPDDAVRQVNPEYVNADKAWAKGYQGQGFSVAIMDDGLNAQHEMFTGKVRGEACFSNANGKGDNLCPFGTTTATGFGVASGQCATQSDICSHGSHVAGIAMGNNHGTIFSAKGVAPEAGVVPIMVFHRNRGTDNCSGGATSCIVASSFDLANALDWVIANATRYGIVAVNMSLGSGTYSSYCDSQTILASGINALRKMNVLTVVAAGNDGDLGVVSHPGCVRNAVTVSSVIISVPDDNVNQAPLVDLLAPGYLVYSALGSGTAAYGTKTGTSMATPYVTGAVAVLRSALPSATADQVEYAMVSTGTQVSYIGWTWTTPRLDVNAAIGVLGGTPPPQGIALVGLVSGRNALTNSYLRFMNSGSASGTAHVSILLDKPRTALGKYDVAVPGNSSVQVTMADIEKAIGFGGSTESLMSAYVDADFKGYLQNVIWNQGGLSLTNITTCTSAIVDPHTFLGNIHTSQVGANYKSQILVHNTGTVAAKAGFDIYDGRTGAKIGSIETAAQIEPNTSTIFYAQAALDAIGFTPSAGQYHLTFKLQNGFKGVAEHIVENVSSGVVTDMSTKCAL